MAMSAGPAESDAPMSDINTTPLVDVMLVLLIIFLITVPVVVQSIDVKLPDTPSQATTTKPENLSLSVREVSGQCQVFWGLEPVDGTVLLDRSVIKLQEEKDRQEALGASLIELPEAHIRADINTPYRCIGGTIYQLQRAGFQKIGFISSPAPGSVPVTR
jgi:biopolymer transport protein ExbD